MAMVHLIRRRRFLTTSRGWMPMLAFNGVWMGCGRRGRLTGRVDGVRPLRWRVLHLLIMSRPVMVEHTFGLRSVGRQSRESECSRRVTVSEWL